MQKGRLLARLERYSLKIQMLENAYFVQIEQEIFHSIFVKKKTITSAIVTIKQDYTTQTKEYKGTKKKLFYQRVFDVKFAEI